MKEFQEEIRKLKAMIVKHENRIRTLEALATEATTVIAKDSGDSLVVKNSDQNDVDSKHDDKDHVDANDDD